jgi:hypothetical protein
LGSVKTISSGRRKLGQMMRWILLPILMFMSGLVSADIIDNVNFRNKSKREHVQGDQIQVESAEFPVHDHVTQERKKEPPKTSTPTGRKALDPGNRPRAPANTLARGVELEEEIVPEVEGGTSTMVKIIICIIIAIGGTILLATSCILIREIMFSN